MKALLLASCALAVCAREPRPTVAAATSPAASDTLRGRVEVVGSDPGMWVVLQMDGGRRAVTLMGDRHLLMRLAGLEAAVWGVHDPRAHTFNVQRVEVRASGGVAALDGVLDRRGGGYVLVTHDGRAHPIAHLPDDLRGMV
ncbi:MAG TPA: hypothetical protein VFJ16_25740, partial [Longimicrobium sp.]|nr:hypothetical protein [Longimicrobium sp.]